MTYDDKQSKVTVIFNDGEVKEYIISAGRGVAAYLSADAGRNGVLTLWNKGASYCIPTHSIREWMIEELPAEVTEAPAPSSSIPSKRRRRKRADDGKAG
ncbi:hypothetical protein EVB41_038 [Rhizobium phage RHph_TM3_14A]|nr:hypothetical protein EVB31_037 [Rhizobium phage RHph_TM29]QIG67503.1 hypothetical protein EVB41_038 [Rhizobium phage RHph_TM3_14A]